MLTVAAVLVAFTLGVFAGATVVAPRVTSYQSRKGQVVAVNTVTIVVSRKIAIAILVLVLGLFGGTGVVGVSLIVQRSGLLDVQQKFNTYVVCEAKYNTDFHATYEARSHAAGKVSKAMDRVVQAVKAQDPKGFAAAVNHYVALRTAQNEAKASHPIPKPPNAVCGPVPKGD